tara:strand:- start:2579 stop:2692 length:114 start_codon:yes stop_codon:yes gene_type:complete
MANVLVERMNNVETTGLKIEKIKYLSLSALKCSYKYE